MSRHVYFQPGSIARVTGRYEFYHAFCFWTGLAVECVAGQTLPPGPKGWLWLLAPPKSNDGTDEADRRSKEHQDADACEADI